MFKLKRIIRRNRRVQLRSKYANVVICIRPGIYTVQYIQKDRSSIESSHLGRPLIRSKSSSTLKANIPTDEIIVDDAIKATYCETNTSVASTGSLDEKPCENSLENRIIRFPKSPEIEHTASTSDKRDLENDGNMDNGLIETTSSELIPKLTEAKINSSQQNFCLMENFFKQAKKQKRWISEEVVMSRNHSVDTAGDKSKKTNSKPAEEISKTKCNDASSLGKPSESKNDGTKTASPRKESNSKKKKEVPANSQNRPKTVDKKPTAKKACQSVPIVEERGSLSMVQNYNPVEAIDYHTADQNDDTLFDPATATSTEIDLHNSNLNSLIVGLSHNLNHYLRIKANTTAQENAIEVSNRRLDDYNHRHFDEIPVYDLMDKIMTMIGQDIPLNPADLHQGVYTLLLHICLYSCRFIYNHISYKC